MAIIEASKKSRQAVTYKIFNPQAYWAAAVKI
jgi:hypothetical protein